MSVETKLSHLQSSLLQQTCDEVLDQMVNLQDDLVGKIKFVRDTRDNLIKELSQEYTKIIYERREIDQEKDAWNLEKERISQIYPVKEDIIKINLCGQQDLCFHRSTLSEVKGSALEKMFSGKHKLHNLKDKIFIDRNPLAFQMMIDFIRNQGELNEQHLANQKMLQTELKYWEIDAKQYQSKNKKKDKIDILQEALDKPFIDLLNIKNKEPFFHEALKQQRINIKELMKDGKLKFGEDFRISSIEEIIEVEWENKFSKIGRVCGYYNQDQSYVLYDGEFNQDNVLNGYGRYITTQNHLVGQFQDHQMHGNNRNTMRDGTIKEGQFKNHMMHGPGKISFADGSAQEGEYQDGVFIRQEKEI